MAQQQAVDACLAEAEDFWDAQEQLDPQHG